MKSNQQYTLEAIRQMKLAKQREVKAKQKQIVKTARAIFEPQKSVGGLFSTMNLINNGIAIFDGFMLGMKVIRRIRGFVKGK